MTPERSPMGSGGAPGPGLRAPGSRGDAVAPVAPVRSLASIVGVLIGLEVTSGILQGFYSPGWSDIAARLGISAADVNWFEAAQLMLSALTVPLLARLGDLVGHRSVLLLATAVTAAGSWTLAFAPSFPLFLVGYAVQGAYVVWLPIEVAVIHRRTRDSPDQHRLTRRAAGILVGSLELAIIGSSLAAGSLAGRAPLTLVLMIPAVAATLCLVALWIGIEKAPAESRGTLDLAGLGLLVLMLGLIMAGFISLRIAGPATPLPWLLIAVGLAAVAPFALYERRLAEPLVDVRLLVSRPQWPIQATAFLIGMSVLGAQIPMATFVRASPERVGYGLGLGASAVSLLIGLYVVFLAVGAFTLPSVARRVGDRPALIGSGIVVALGYLWLVPFHGSIVEVCVAMCVAGIGTGGIIPSLPAAAAAAAPADRTGFATGMTNTTKTVGGAIASSLFAIALAGTVAGAGSADGAAGAGAGAAGGAAGAPPLAGYLTVWGVCAATALAAAVVLAFLPKAGSAGRRGSSASPPSP